ncbi:hypothetical protein CTW00_01248 [Streptococcus iniae]|nr:hypothetical protein [Streptococcus iniae]ATX39429.1 hypothetical protein CTW00_01248 [Streptococcus iniae]EKB53019.1 hypothetical protein A0G_0854 [Streptococcus iniae 9117]
MGNDVFDSTIAIQEGAHIFAHSRKDGQEGKAYLIINNSESSETLVNLPKEAELYLLEGEAKDKRARRMTLNGQLLQLSEDNQLPELLPQTVPAGQLSIPKTSCAFLIL